MLCQNHPLSVSQRSSAAARSVTCEIVAPLEKFQLWRETYPTTTDAGREAPEVWRLFISSTHLRAMPRLIDASATLGAQL